jgi:hypothetical protein
MVVIIVAMLAIEDKTKELVSYSPASKGQGNLSWIILDCYKTNAYESRPKSIE